MTTIKEKAEVLMQKSEIVVLSSVNPEGYPRPVPMSKIKSEGISTIWMATGKSSLKTKDFHKNPQAGLCLYTEGDSIVLTGNVEIVTDDKNKKELWQGWFIQHFPKGVNDPEYILLKFQANHATLWIDQQFIHRKL